MILRTITFAGGLCGAAALSQYPEFTQQYVQRLGGQVDALTVVLRDFDASAEKADMTRDEALASMGGTVFLENRRRDMRETIDRHARLSDDLAVLSTVSPIERITLPHRLRDTALASATFKEFRPALPLSLEGAISGGLGFAVGWAVLAGLLRFIAWPFRRRRKAHGF